ncbi:SDR family NAD(P)-dependent oxidoreductase [Mycobacterium sp. TY815]|uniref:SDR family NAD(P)-dependent oxidoreductase n=1 Tax=Mycobacterium sp. TY815 TaxID=3050581 RepID=UPI000FBC8157|nr:SDR family NAD(P)-dependent oxidoreductase [Mycobacterium sp. TY815]MDP7702943.1 SDR family NAD(P)-dependent oxidoreductase [Mycobacterium sp. TY815]RUP00735.1 MAG: SDR family NAD(P)-dependent oxidoreductase [Mycobacterium sp.]
MTSQNAPTPDRRAIITEALRKIDDLTVRLEVAEASHREPIAVVGIGCRFPGGVTNPEEFWDLLRDGRSGIIRVPGQRWDADAYYTDDHTVPGTICSREGGFLTGWQPEEFDAEFFAISPREAAAMDPQQRLLLEVAWEALENSGVAPHTIRGTQTSVFVGVTSYDYMVTLAGQLRPEDLDAYIPTGNALNFTAGRLAYFLGAQGPAVVVDTACSSSLVAIHLASQSLRSRESDMALVGGTNLLLSPGPSIACSRWGMLSPEGQCKTFDAAADGYVRSEGAGVVVLKRLTDAQRDGNRILAVVRGSAVNQDGASSGVTVPNGPAQQALLRKALATAELAPADIDYVEAHGTGTPLGDPIELDSLSKVFSERAGRQPLVLGSVKTNLGHLEAAAGIAGFIKTVLALGHRHIPRHLNFRQLTPHVSEGVSRLVIAADGMAWPATEGPRRAGVSSFGVSGTNAHVVLEQAPDPVVPQPVPQAPVCTLVISGKTPQRIAATAAALADWWEGPGTDIAAADVAHTLNHHRARQVKFATVVARDRAQAIAGLRAVAADPVCNDGSAAPGTVFVYSGQGSQWIGMGRQLLADEPAFAAAVAELEPDFVAQVGFSLHQTLTEGRELVGIENIQPVLVGVQLALTALWRHYGVKPDAVIGHSMGEVSAAVVAGALSPADGLKVIATRSRLMAALAGQGAMALLELDASDTAAAIAAYPELTLAVHASPRQSVIAGPPDQVDAVIAAVATRDLLARRIDVDVASHHPIIDPILPELRSALADLQPRPSAIPIITTAVQGPTPALLGADYWTANLRNPVRFHQAVSLAAQSHHTFVEVSPHPLLTYAITDTLGEANARVLGTLQRDTDDTVTFHTNVSATHGTRPPDTPHPPEPHPLLPGTPWQHTRHWIDAGSTTATAGHPLLGSGAEDPTNGTRVWECAISPDLLWLGDHCVDGVCVLPGAAYADIALAAATETFAGASWMIRELTLDQLMHVTDNTMIATTLTGDDQSCRVEIRTRSSGSGWIKHATATLAPASPAAPEPAEPVVAGTPVDPEELYRRLRAAGQQHGAAFQGIAGLSLLPSGAARAQVRLPATAKTGARKFLLHPVMMDIAMQTLGATRPATELTTGAQPAIVLPVGFTGVRVYGDVLDGVTAIASLAPTDDPDRLAGRVSLLDDDGRPVLDIERVEMAVLRSGTRELENRLFSVHWAAAALDGQAAAPGALLLVGSDDVTAALHAELTGRIACCETVSDDEAMRAAIGRRDISWDGIVVVCPPRSADEALPLPAQLDLARARTQRIADIVRTVSRVGARNSPRLWIVTRGAQQLGPAESVTLAQTQLRGVARVLTFEHPELKTTVVDLDSDGTPALAGLADELLAGSDQDEVALRAGQRYVSRLVATPVVSGGLIPENRFSTVDIDAGGAFVLDSELQVRAAGRPEPGDNQLEVRVLKAPLNHGGEVTECLGLVESGRRVIAFGSGPLGSHLVADADLVVPVPDVVSDAEAAGFGLPYLTAWHALCTVGRLAPGEKVLIQAGGDGVELAAVAIATMIGAQVHTSAPAEPVDIVLNSLPGEAIHTGVQLLAAGGRFIQLGGADTSLGLEALARSASFAVVDIGLNLRLQPTRYRAYLEEILGHAAAGRLAPLPVTEFDLEHAVDALRATGKHPGRVTLSIPQTGRITALAPRPAPPLVRPDGGYVVTGGLGGLGFVTARWLAEQGAGLVVLNGRSAPGPEMQAAIDGLNAAGARVEVVTGDLADPDTSRRLVAAVGDAGFRLAGVVHSAMVLADEIVLNMSDAASARVFAPKVAGGWWLHEATKDAGLDWWVSFSSVSSLVGAPGQGSYASANSWIDGLVAYRRAHGLPAAGINWGPWAQVGRAQFFADLGVSMITPAQGLAALELVLAADRARTGVFALDARQWFQSFPAAAGSSLFATLRESITVEQRTGGGRIRAELDATDPADRPRRLATAIADEIRAVLRSTDQIDHDLPMEQLGLDSLMALELRNRLEASLGTTLPVALVWAYPTITDLAGALCERLGYQEDAPQAESAEEEPELSDEELDLLSDLVAASELEAATEGAE